MKNNKKKYPYNDNIDIEECVFIRNYKYIEKDFMDQKIQKCSEYTYIPSSKNTSSTSVLVENHKNNIDERDNKNNKYPNMNLKNENPYTIYDDTEICNSPDMKNNNNIKQEENHNQNITHNLNNSYYIGKDLSLRNKNLIVSLNSKVKILI